MKKLLYPALMYIVILMTATLSVSAQTPNQADEYKKLLKNIMELSGTSSQSMIPKFVESIKQMQPQQDDTYWEKFAAKWTKEIEKKVLEVSIPIYQQHLTLDEMKEVLAFYQSPLGKKLGQTTMALSNETLALMKQLGTKMVTEIMPQVENTITSDRVSIADQNYKQDKKITDGAYTIPLDSIETTRLIYQRGMSTKPILHAIERRQEDTKVTFLQPIYYDRQWLYYSPGFKIIDTKTGDEYIMRGFDKGLPFNKLLIVNGFNNQYIQISLIFPKLQKHVKKIDIVETPHKDEIDLPSNNDGIAKAYYAIKLKDYQKAAPKTKKIYY